MSKDASSLPPIPPIKQLVYHKYIGLLAVDEKGALWHYDPDPGDLSEAGWVPFTMARRK